MNKLKIFLHKLLFPKYHNAVQTALEVTRVYMLRSPSKEKQQVGQDIFIRIKDKLR